MAILKNISTALSRGLPSASSRGKSSLHESTKHKNGASASEPETDSLKRLKSRLLNTLIQLCGKDQMLTGMVRKLVVPILLGLSQAQIDEGATFLFVEIARLKNDGLITLMNTDALTGDLGTIENRQE